MNFKELHESSGGMAKRWLESQTSPHYWTDTKGNRYSINALIQFPTKSPQLPMDQLVAEIEAAADKLGFTLQDIDLKGKQPVNNGAGMLVVMQDAKGKLYPFFKFYQRRTMDNLGMMWSVADFGRDTGLTWEETRVTGKGVARQAEVIKRIELKPVNVIEVNTNLKTIQVPAIVDAKLKEKGIDPAAANAIGQLTNNALLGKNTPVAGLAPYERDIRVDFGEVAAPLALISGSLAGGQYAQVEAELLKPAGLSWKTAKTVFYPAALNEPLYDSQLNWADGTTLRISNKAEGKGGAASLASIAGVIKKYPERFDNKDRALLKGKYKKFVTAINTITENTSLVGLLTLGVVLGYINANEAEIIRVYAQQKITKGTRGLTKNLINILKDRTIFAAQTDKPDYAVCYHLTAALARLIVKDLNQDPALTTEFFRFILERANLIQVNQFTTRSGDAVAWEKFDVVWPPVFTGKIVFSASDFQSNKPVKSRLAFKT